MVTSEGEKGIGYDNYGLKIDCYYRSILANNHSIWANNRYDSEGRRKGGREGGGRGEGGGEGGRGGRD